MFQVKDNSMGQLKYVGISRAIVIDNDDPAKRGRIRVNSPALGETSWIPYLTTPGTFSVPDVDSVVYIQCDSGYYNYPIAWGNFNYGTDDDLQFPAAFQRVSPTNRGVYTPGGHLLELDDGTDPITKKDSGLRITTAAGIKVDIKDETSDSSVDILMPSGTHFNIDGTTDKITLETAFGDSVEISATSGIQLSTPAAGGASISLNAGDITITGSGGAELKLNQGKVALGSTSAELLDLLDQQLDAIINNAPTFVSTSVGPGVLNPSVVSTLTTIKTMLGLIKGSL